MKRLFVLLLLLLLCWQAGWAQLQLHLHIEKYRYPNDDGTITILQGTVELYCLPQVFSSNSTEIVIQSFNPNAGDVYLSFTSSYHSSNYPRKAYGEIFNASSSSEYVLKQKTARVYINDQYTLGGFHVWAHTIPNAPSLSMVTTSVCRSNITFETAMNYNSGVRHIVAYRKDNDSWRDALVQNSRADYFPLTYEANLDGYQGYLELRVKAWTGEYYHHSGNTIPITTEPSNSIYVYCWQPPEINNLLIKHACGSNNGYVAFQFGSNVDVGDKLKIAWTGAGGVGEVVQAVGDSLLNGSTNVPTLSLSNRSFPAGAYTWTISREGQSCSSTVSGEIRTLPQTNGTTDAPCNNGANETYSILVNRQ